MMTRSRIRLTRAIVLVLLLALLAQTFAACEPQKPTPSTKTYTITYDGNGGSLDTMEPSTYKTGDTSESLPTPTRAGWTFEGWYLTPSPDKTKDTAYKTVPTDMAQDLTFYALWSQVPDGAWGITYHLNGGVFDTSVATYYETGDDPYDLPLPTKKGYSFLGWFDEEDPDEGELYMQLPTDEERHLEFWAAWRADTYTATLIPNGGTLSGGNTISYTVEDNVITLPTPTGASAFLGWYTSATLTGTAVTEIDPSSAVNMRLYAKWEAIRYTLTYHLNGGEMAGSTTTRYTSDGGVMQLPEPTMSGKYFVAWYTDAACTSTPMWKFPCSKAADMDLYAKWADTEAEASAVRDGVLDASSDINVSETHHLYIDMTKSTGTTGTTVDGQYVTKFNFSSEDDNYFYPADALNNNVDFSRYNTFRFSIYSEKATGGKFGIIFSKSSIGNGYAQIPITVNWEGWKEFEISLDTMTGKNFDISEEKPFTFVWISNIGWGYNGENLCEGTVVYIGSIYLVDAISSYDPILESKDLTEVKDNIRRILIGDAALRADSLVKQNNACKGKAEIDTWISQMSLTGTDYLWSATGTVKNNGTNIQSTYERIYEMARSYACGIYCETANLQAIQNALDWMYRNAYNENTKESGNWWHWEIGAPLPLVNTLLLLEKDIDASLKTKCLRAIEHFTPQPKYTYANRTWTGYVAFFAALLRNDAEDAVSCMRLLLSCFDYASLSSDRDGFYEDGSFIQHKYTPYITGYGGNYLSELSSVLGAVQGTSMALDQSYVDRFFSIFFESYCPMIYRGSVLPGCFGRNGWGYNPANTASTWVAYAFKVAHLANDVDRARFYSFVATLMEDAPSFILESYLSPVAIENYRAFAQARESGSIDRSSDVGAYLMTASDRVLQKTESYAALVAMSSTRIYRYEAINNANGNGWYLGDGVLYVLTKSHPDAYNTPYFKNIDSKLLPGITSTNATRIAEIYDVDSNPFGSYDVVGGVSNDAANPLYSMAYMHFGADQKAESYQDGVEDLDVKKVWFFFDDEIVCLGSGITSTTDSEVFTIIDNRYVGNASVKVSADTFPISPSGEDVLENVTELYFDQFGGYYFPTATDVRMNKENGFLRFTLDHGVRPDDATYAYVMLPDMSAGNVHKYQETPDIEILANTTTVAAVREKTLGMTGIAFWEAGTSFTVGEVKMTAGAPCAVMLTEGENGDYTFSVSEPTQLLSDLTITLTGEWNVSANDHMTVTVVGGNTVITVDTAGALGATFTCTISK